MMHFEKTYPFGKVDITDEIEGDETVRIMRVDGGRESACYTDEDRIFDIRFAYMHEFAHVAEAHSHGGGVGLESLLIGGAGFSFPKYFISRFPYAHMDVVELHGEMYELAMKYFYLDKLYERYDLHRNQRLRVYFEDGNQYIERCSTRYDIIYNDAYQGRTPDEGLLSDKAASGMQKLLNPKGIYVINLIGAVEGYGSMQSVLVSKILKNHFRHVRMRQVNPNLSRTERQNLILTAEGPRRYNA